MRRLESPRTLVAIAFRRNPQRGLLDPGAPGCLPARGWAGQDIPSQSSTVFYDPFKPLYATHQVTQSSIDP
jgi:hypothetical protein